MEFQVVEQWLSEDELSRVRSMDDSALTVYYNEKAAVLWCMGDSKYELAAEYIMGNPDFCSFWNLYMMVAVLKENTGPLDRQTGSVYFLQDDNTGNIKVGATKGCPVRRTNQIKGMNHAPLTLLFHIKAERGCEGELHKLLKTHRIHHEWFAAAPAKSVISLLNPFKEKGEPLMVADIAQMNI